MNLEEIPKLLNKAREALEAAGAKIELLESQNESLRFELEVVKNAAVKWVRELESLLEEERSKRLASMLPSEENS